MLFICNWYLLNRSISSNVRSKIWQADPTPSNRSTLTGPKPHFVDILKGVIWSDVMLAWVRAVMLAVALHHLPLGIAWWIILWQC